MYLNDLSSQELIDGFDPDVPVGQIIALHVLPPYR
jgi:hypothetical protein